MFPSFKHVFLLRILPPFIYTRVERALISSSSHYWFHSLSLCCILHAPVHTSMIFCLLLYALCSHIICRSSPSCITLVVVVTQCHVTVYTMQLSLSSNWNSCGTGPISSNGKRVRTEFESRKQSASHPHPQIAQVLKLSYILLDGTRPLRHQVSLVKIECDKEVAAAWWWCWKTVIPFWAFLLPT